MLLRAALIKKLAVAGSKLRHEMMMVRPPADAAGRVHGELQKDLLHRKMPDPRRRDRADALLLPTGHGGLAGDGAARKRAVDTDEKLKGLSRVRRAHERHQRHDQ